VQGLLAAAGLLDAADAETEAGLMEQIDAILEVSEAAEETTPATYDEVLAAFEAGTHPLLLDTAAPEQSVEQRLRAALKRERKRRRRAEAALDAALRQRTSGSRQRATRRSLSRLKDR
jgi:hypothetical protein